jgi:Ca2+-binding EF-hand superfamily protein
MNPVSPGIAILGGVLLIAGAVALINAAGRAAQEAETAAAKEKAFRDSQGWSGAELVKELFSPYDRDGDGRIGYDVIRGTRALGESVRTFSRRSTEPLYGYNIPRGTRILKETTATYSIEPMLRKADANNDGIVSTADVLALIGTFDQNRDGRISRAERAEVEVQLSETLVSSETRTVGVIPPATPNPPRK